MAFSMDPSDDTPIEYSENENFTNDTTTKTFVAVESLSTKSVPDENHGNDAVMRSYMYDGLPASKDNSTSNTVIDKPRFVEERNDDQKKEETTKHKPISTMRGQAEAVKIYEQKKSTKAHKEGSVKRRGRVQFKLSSGITSKPSKPTLNTPNDSMQLTIRSEIIQIDIQGIQTIKHLGRGGFGSVDMIKIKSRPDIRMAVKRITMEDKRAHATRTELDVLRKFGANKCPYIISYYGAMIDLDNRELCIFMELMDITMKEFYKTMHRMKNTILRENLQRFLIRLIHNIVSALDFLANENILHRDIKPANILINKNCLFKLCDFGICCEMSVIDSVENTVAGTIAYLPPRIDDKSFNRPTIQSDMWGFGMTLAEIVHGKHPCQAVTDGIDGKEFKQQLLIESWRPDVPLTYITIRMRKLILHLLKRHPEDRPASYKAILHLSFIRCLFKRPSKKEYIFYNGVIEKSGSMD